MSYKVKFRILFLAFTMTLGLAFQNCSFTGAPVEITLESMNQPNGDTSYGEVKSISSELQPLDLPLVTDGLVEFPDGLPRGASYDANSQSFSWLPQRGQAGDYLIPFRTADHRTGTLALTVQPIEEKLLRLGGPPFRYRDGDVGYIFVHGKGDVDRCVDRTNLAQYWGNSPQLVAPDAINRTLACYDGRKSVIEVAGHVAQQILDAKCGRLDKCIIITHSMGGLLLEYMLLHARSPLPTDPEPGLFQQHEVFKAVKERSLLVISLASASGGSKVASMINSQGPLSIGQELIGTVSRWVGSNNDATKNLTVQYASNVVAPMTQDPGVPFFMVPGYSIQTLAESQGFFENIYDVFRSNIPYIVFNGDREMAALDSVTAFKSRSDGLVDFRSACGVASDNENDGPGRSAQLEEHFRYCFRAPKKPNHFVWFASNLNHLNITIPYDRCRDTGLPCYARFPNADLATLVSDSKLIGRSAVEVIRNRLADVTPIRAPAAVPTVKATRLVRSDP